MELAKLVDAPSSEDVQILAVSKDSAEDARKLIELIAEKGGSEPGFPILTDEGSRVIDRYGIRNPKSEGLPHPAVYVIDREGKISWQFVEVDYRVRPSNQQIVDALNELR